MADLDALENLSAILRAPGDLKLEHRPVPAVGANDVLLSMACVGICGSDVKYWKYGRCGRFTVTSPMVLGHEGSGVVMRCGRNVTHLKEGDRVAIEPGVPCSRCELCRQGNYNLCADIKFCATPPVHGNLCRYYVHPADFCYKLPDHVTLEEGALVEPLAVAVYACQRGHVTVGSKLLVCGAGPVGILVAQVAKAMGAAKVAMTDIADSRLEFAKEFGIDVTVNVKTVEIDSAVQIIHSLMGSSPDVAVECAGSDSSMVTCIKACAAHGDVVLVGRGSMCPEVPLVEAATKEVDIKGVFRYANCYPKALALLASGRVNAKALVTHRFKLQQSVDAFTTALKAEKGTIKVIINCEDRDDAVNY